MKPLTSASRVAALLASDSVVISMSNVVIPIGSTDVKLTKPLMMLTDFDIYTITDLQV